MSKKFLITDILKRKDIVLLMIITILAILFFRQCNKNIHLKNELSIQSSNLAALQDSIRIEKNKNGKLTFIKKALLADKRNLEYLNKDLAEELEKAKGKIILLQKINSEITADTFYINNTITLYPNGEYSLDWRYDTIYSDGNYRRISGNSFFKFDTLNNKILPGFTRINNDEIGISFVTGLREKDKSIEIFITPNYPGMTITSIDGAIIDPQKSDVLKKMFPNKKWAIGPYAGIGIGAGYGLNGQPIAGPIFSIGISLQWSWIKF